MKYVLVLLVIVIAAGIWRNRRRDADNDAPRQTRTPRQAAAQPQDMVACAHCGLHLPRGDALLHGTAASPQYYCCAQHRSQGPA